MKISESWLREFIDLSLDSDTLADHLSMAGLEVEESRVCAPFFEHVVVGHVINVIPHPNADRLRVCTVDVGEDSPLQIVCGAPNVEVGVKVPCARIGAVLPGNFVIKAAKLRDVESSGMLCSAKELGIDEDHEGLLLLPSDAPVGMDFRQYYDLNDKILTLKLTPNRADCLSVYGVARDLAAITQSTVKPLEIEEVQTQIQDHLSVEIEDSKACLGYYGRLIRGVNANASTPEWMRRRLERSGIRCVCAIVDITNYVLLELGQPLHAFDADKIQGGIHVRWAKQGETLTLLNEKTVNLEPDLLVIADDMTPLALAGVMGGMPSGVSGKSTNILLESGLFAQSVVAGRARRMMLSSEGAHRFERGVDMAMVKPALERATALILSICGGSAGPAAGVELPSFVPKHLTLRKKRIATLLGIEISDQEILAYLQTLGMAPTLKDEVFSVTVPSYRLDIDIEEDLIEEVARLYGYDNIPCRPAKARLAMLPIPGTLVPESQICAELVARDYCEVINYAFVDQSWELDFLGNETPVFLQNPIASYLNVMRSSLIGGLIDTLRKNVNRQHERVRIFELGRVFIKSNADILQPEKLAGLAFGPRVEEQWGHHTEKVDFYDVKADIEALFAPRLIRFEVWAHPSLHPGRAARILYKDKEIGIIGELHPKWVQKYGLVDAPIIFELELDQLTSSSLTKSTMISRQPLVRRDLALVVDETLPVQVIFDTLEKINPLLKSVSLFDVYQGPKIAEGKKSLAFKLILQDSQKTLTDQEVDAVVNQVIMLAQEKCGAVLRD